MYCLQNGSSSSSGPPALPPLDVWLPMSPPLGQACPQVGRGTIACGWSLSGLHWGSGFRPGSCSSLAVGEQALTWVSEEGPGSSLWGLTLNPDSVRPITKDDSLLNLIAHAFAAREGFPQGHFWLPDGIPISGSLSMLHTTCSVEFEIDSLTHLCLFVFVSSGASRSVPCICPQKKVSWSPVQHSMVTLLLPLLSFFLFLSPSSPSHSWLLGTQTRALQSQATNLAIIASVLFWHLFFFWRRGFPLSVSSSSMVEISLLQHPESMGLLVCTKRSW